MAECTQNRLLHALYGEGGCGVYSLDFLAASFSGKRKRVSIALGKLISRGLVACLRPKADLKHDSIGRITANKTPTTSYHLSKAGREFVEAGKQITSGPKRAHTGQRKTRKETFRARLWRAFRMKTKATVCDLVEIAATGDSEEDGIAVHDSASTFLRALVRAGVAVRLATRARGFAPTSPGFCRYALVRDLGPQCPLIGRKHVFDPNSSTVIPYLPSPQRRASAGQAGRN